MISFGENYCSKKTVVYQKPNLALLRRFNILQFYNFTSALNFFVNLPVCLLSFVRPQRSKKSMFVIHRHLILSDGFLVCLQSEIRYLSACIGKPLSFVQRYNRYKSDTCSSRGFSCHRLSKPSSWQGRASSQSFAMAAGPVSERNQGEKNVFGRVAPSLNCKDRRKTFKA